METVEERDWLAGRFEENRDHLRAVAYRLLGSISEADDAVQEAWLRLSRSDTAVIENLGGWLTTVVARICLDMLRSRASRREESLGDLTESIARNETGTNPEQEALLADSVGLALLVVLNRLAPAERLAFVLHDMFAVPFEELASIVGRSPSAARQLASRARRRIQGKTPISELRVSQERKVVDAFLAALRAGDLDGILAVLDPDVVRRADRVAVPAAEAREIRGARALANEVLTYRDRARFARTAIVDGAVGILVAPQGRLRIALRCRVKDGKIVAMDVIADPARLSRLEVAVLDD